MNDIVNAEKGNNLSPHNLHIRLRVLETVVLLSLILSLVQGYVAMHAQKEVNNVQAQMGVR